MSVLRQEEGWIQMYEDIFAEFSYAKDGCFASKLKNAQLPPEVLEALPLYSDGMLTWDVIRSYTISFLRVFYDGDAALVADEEVQAFWAHFKTQITADWGLPELSLDSLADLCANLIWWVTAGHESVGSITEYLTSPVGFPGKLVDGKCEADVQSFAQGLVVMSLTGTRQPALMSSWAHLFNDVEGWSAETTDQVLEVVRKFQVDLQVASESIYHRNQARAQRGDPCHYVCDPAVLETSVSI